MTGEQCCGSSTNSKHVLFGHLSQTRAIVPIGIVHGVEEDLRGRASVLAVLFVANFVDYEQEVDKVATGAKLIEVGVGIGVRDEQLIASEDKVCSLPVDKEVVAVHPCGRLAGSGLVVRAGGTLQRAHGVQVWKTERRQFCDHVGCEAMVRIKVRQECCCEHAEQLCSHLYTYA